MFRAINCLTLEHDARLVLLAVAVCLCASFGTVRLLQRACATNGRARNVWIATAGAAGGFGIWATHFIAMLAYAPVVAVAYDIWLTLLSLAAAIIITAGGIGCSVLSSLPWRGVIGGAIVGAGIATMHYLGMAALDMPGRVTWSSSLVAISVALGIAFGTAALTLAHRQGRQHMLVGALLLTAAILSLHFTAMGAATVVPDPLRGGPGYSLSSTMLAIVIAGAALALLGVSLVSALYDARLNALRARQQIMEEADAKVRQEHLRLDAAVNNMSQGLCMFDADGRLVICNRRYLAMYGLSEDMARPGTPLEDLLAARARQGSFSGDIRQYVSSLSQSVANKVSTSNLIELEDRRVVAVVSQSIAGGGWVATHEDITEQRRAAQRIAFLAHHDMLTGLPNRTYFSERLDDAIECARSSGLNFALFCIDLDRFKEVNDVFGHSVGDALLREVADRFRQAASENFIARLGGDEFTILADDCSAERAAEIAGHVLGAFESVPSIEGQLLRIGVSVGIAIYPRDGTNGDTLLTNADAALYRCKAGGRNCFRFFSSEMDRELRERRLVQRELRTALEHGQLAVHYQPQARMDGGIVGFEALVRWQHPSRGLLAPGLFVPIAEESGLIMQVGEWVLREACREAASWEIPRQIAINLSPVQFRHGDLPGLVHSVLLESGLAPQRLELEITESILINDFSRAKMVLRRLRLLGVRISLDDFGTGYSSLSYLQSFRFDRIKIDRSLIAHVERNPRSAAIVGSVINLAHSLDLPVIAEGVETEGQRRFLAGLSCDEMQGCLIGRPCPIDHYVAVVRKPRSDRVRVAV
jgi:diguanylate cyclase (GGDEF)-like protein